MTSQTKRYRRLLITPELLFELFHAGTHPPHAYNVIADAIPEDAKCVNVRHGWPDVLEILIESQEFEELHDGDEIPKLSPLIRQEHACPHGKPLTNMLYSALCDQCISDISEAINRRLA